jgi:hypothetical protein
MLFEDRARAESFGAAAALYDRARPSYPSVLNEALIADGSRRVLDVGCGARCVRSGHLGGGSLTEAGPFGCPEVATFPWRKAYATREWLEHLESHSDHHRLPAGRREAPLEAIGEAIDGIGGSFEMAYETVLVSARRT